MKNKFDVSESFYTKVSALSDEFQSTFSIVNDVNDPNNQAIANMFDISEADRVLTLVEKHLGWDRKKMKIIKTGQVCGTYDVWVLVNLKYTGE